MPGSPTNFDNNREERTVLAVGVGCLDDLSLACRIRLSPLWENLIGWLFLGLTAL